MKIAKMVLATATIAFIGSSAMAQQAVNGSITKVDEANGKITIQQTQSGTVGATTGGAEKISRSRTALCSTPSRSATKWSLRLPKSVA